MTDKTQHPQFHNWSAKRSGPYMTVTGKNAEGEEIKATKITDITGGADYSVAIDENLELYYLMNSGI